MRRGWCHKSCAERQVSGQKQPRDALREFLDDTAEEDAALYEKFYAEYQRFLKGGVVTGDLVRFAEPTVSSFLVEAG